MKIEVTPQPPKAPTTRTYPWLGVSPRGEVVWFLRYGVGISFTMPGTDIRTGILMQRYTDYDGVVTLSNESKGDY